MHAQSSDALAAAQAAVDADPRSGAAQLALAAALQAAGRGEEALAALERAIALEPGEAGPHVQRASLLLAQRRPEAARAALAEALALDPNRFDAYILQAQLALAGGDADEAARLNVLAGRVTPDHPRSIALGAMVALQRDEPQEALAQATRAAEALPDDPQVLLALGLAYLSNRHFGFAEQTFRRVLEGHPDHDALRMLLAQTLHAQQRPDEALDALVPLLGGDSAQATPARLRLAAGLAMQVQRLADAREWARRALLAQPGDRLNVELFMRAWLGGEDAAGRADEVRRILDGCLASVAQAGVLWQARLAVEHDAAAADAVVDRWNAAAPDDLGAQEARLLQLRRRGDGEAVLAAARRIVAANPGHAGAHRVIVEALKAGDSGAAVAHVQGLLARAGDDGARARLLGWIGALEDEADDPAAAVEHWTQAARLRASAGLPLSPVSLPVSQLPAGPLPPWDADAPPADGLRTLFLWGGPGSCVENVAAALSGLQGFSGDRFTADRAPGDAFQRYASVPALSEGSLTGEAAMRSWREALPGRGLGDGAIIDWLVWWDNALLRALCPHLADAAVLFVVRDPRDMLLEWLAHGSPAQFALADPAQAAAWLGSTLSQMTAVVADGLYRAALLKIDGVEADAGALAGRLSEVLGIEDLQVPVPLRPGNLPAGHWRRYAGALAVPFATLAPVAHQLGYPAD